MESLTDLDNKAQQLCIQGLYPEAEVLYRQIVKDKEQKLGTVHPFLIGTLNKLATVLSELGNYSEAVEFSERALGIVEQQLGSEHLNYAKQLGTLGVYLAEQGNYSGAEDALSRCHAILEKILGPEHQDVANSQLNLAGLLYMRGSYSEALPIFRSNVSILEQSLGVDHFDLIEPLNNLAGCLCKLGIYADAEPIYHRSLKLREKKSGPDHPDTANALSNIASFHSYLGNFSKSEQLYKRSLSILENNPGNSTPAVADVLINQANLHTINGEHSKAEVALNRSLSIHITCFGAESFETAKSMRSLASCLCHLKRIDEAETLYRQCITIMKKRVGPDNFDVAISQRCLADLLMGYSKHNEAKILYLRSLATLDQQLGPEHPEVAKSLIGLAKHLEASKRIPGAIFCAKLAINILQNVRKNVSDLGEANLHFFDVSLESMYGYLAGLLRRADRFGEAEFVMGMLKEKEFFEFLRRDIECNFGIKGIEWNSVETLFIDKFSKITLKLYDVGKKVGTLKQIKNRTHEQNSNLAALEEELYCEYKVLSEFIDSINEVLPDTCPEAINSTCFQLIDPARLNLNTAAVIPLSDKYNFSIDVVMPHGRKIFTTDCTSDQLSEKILQFRHALNDHDSFDFLPFAKELYNITIRPIETYLSENNIDTILWMLNGSLRLLPLSALHDGKRFVVEKYCNVSISTISSIGAMKHEPWNALGMGATQADDAHPALPAVLTELEGIIGSENSTGILPGKILLDDAFTLTNMQAHLTKGYKVAHFASHFELNPVNETMSYLLLGDRSRLRMDKLRAFAQLFEGVDLVTFSACNTGLGTTGVQGRAVDGIGYLGELQGARTVLGTLWKVHDSSTSMLMREFYALREHGCSKAKALQQAQFAMLTGKLCSDEGHDFSHPFFWAPFVLIGNES